MWPFALWRETWQPVRLLTRDVAAHSLIGDNGSKRVAVARWREMWQLIRSVASCKQYALTGSLARAATDTWCSLGSEPAARHETALCCGSFFFRKESSKASS